MVFFVVFLIVALWPLKYDGDIRVWSLTLSIIFLILGILNSKLLTPLNKLWFKFGIFLGSIVSPVVMGLVYFLVLAPIGIFMRLLGKDLLKNPEYANTLIRIAKEGVSGFYSGTIAETIVAAVQEDPYPGGLTLSDLKNYKTIIRPVICGPFRDMSICTTSPPSSGGAQIMIAGLYDHLVKNKSSQADKVLAFVDAQRLAYADRDHYFGDPDEVDIPLDALINPTYLKHRASERFDPSEKPIPGNPAQVIDTLAFVPNWGKDNTLEAAGTTHLSIVDGNGNAVAMTATIESAFGSQRWAAGFLLNNEMTDFAREVPADGTQLANAVAPNRRPRSSMSPTMIFDNNNQLLMITG